MKTPARYYQVLCVLVIIGLLVTIVPRQGARGQSSTLTFTPEADATVDQAHPRKNYGTSATLSVDGSPIIRTYIRFNVSNLNGASITGAKLRLYVVDDSASGFSVAKANGNDWSETGITYKKAPSFGSAYGSIGAYGVQQWIEIGIDGAVTSGGLVTLVLTTSYDTTTAFASRETGANAPQLVLTLNSTQPSATPTRSSSPTATKIPTNPPLPTSTATPIPVPSATPTPTGQPMPVGPTGSWRLVFRDEFDGSALNTSKWHTCFWWATTTCSIESNHELELYNPDDILVQNGLLRLRAQHRDMVAWNGTTYHYTSGMVMTGGRKNVIPPEFTFTYGYAEARVKVPHGKGFWPAFGCCQ